MMMTFENIGALLQQAFGIVPQRLLLQPQPQPEPQAGYTMATASHALAHDTTGLLGVAFVEPFNLAAATDWRGVAFAGMQLPATTMCDVSRKRNIVQTAVAGRNGSVKELISCEDYVLRFRGLLINEEGLDPPYALLHQFQQMQVHEGPIPVEGRLFRALGIDAIVVEDIAIRQVQGTPGVLAFDMSAISDNAEEFAIIRDL